MPGSLDDGLAFSLQSKGDLLSCAFLRGISRGLPQLETASGSGILGVSLLCQEIAQLDGDRKLPPGPQKGKRVMPAMSPLLLASLPGQRAKQS